MNITSSPNMEENNVGRPVPTSEVGPNECLSVEVQHSNSDSATRLLTSMESLLSRLVAIQQNFSSTIRILMREMGTKKLTSAIIAIDLGDNFRIPLIGTPEDGRMSVWPCRRRRRNTDICCRIERQAVTLTERRPLALRALHFKMRERPRHHVNDESSYSGAIID